MWAWRRRRVSPSGAISICSVRAARQMTTDRTAIRRWLAVGGAAHRPPWGPRKARTSRHCRAAGGNRRGDPGRDRRDRRRCRAGEGRRDAPLGAGGAARERLALLAAGAPERRPAADGAQPARPGDRAARGRRRRRPPATAVHETRKAIKRLRTIVGLLEGELGESALRARGRGPARGAAAPGGRARRGGAAQHARRSWSGPTPRSSPAGAGVARLRRQLVAERDEAERAHARRRGARAQVVATSCARCAARAGLAPPRAPGHRRRRGGPAPHLPPGPPAPAPGGARQGRRRARDAPVAQAGQGPALRRRDARSAGSRRRRGPGRGGRGQGRARTRAEAAWLRRLARRADELGELLGEEHDLALLAEWLQSRRASGGKAPAAVGRAPERRCFEADRPAAQGACAGVRCATASASTGASPQVHAARRRRLRTGGALAEASRTRGGCGAVAPQPTLTTVSSRLPLGSETDI